MKKTAIILLVMLTFASSAVMADELPGVPEKFAQAFKKSFPAVTEVSWGGMNDFRIAEFRENQIKHLVYFDENAILFAVVRYVNPAFMPFKTAFALKEKFGDLDKNTVLEITLNGDELFYLMDVFHKNKRLTIKVYPGGGTTIIKSERFKLLSK